jgi:hypothetical protein
MDNGLIFPYPLVCANAESSDANHPNRGLGLRVWLVGSVGSEGVVGE